MKTSKPFSTISYNSEKFLKAKLDGFVNDGILDFWAFIDHAPEEDEKKAHKHVYFRPSGLISTAYIDNELREQDPENPDKPLKCTLFVSSKFDDWFLYGCHDTAYLASKGQVRKHKYVRSQFASSDDDSFCELIRCIDRSKYVGMERIIDAVENEVPFEMLVRLGQVPIQLINQYKYAYECLCAGVVQRAGRQTHTPKDEEKAFDPVTGELLETPKNSPTKQTKMKTEL